MKKFILLVAVLALCTLFIGCESKTNINVENEINNETIGNNNEIVENIETEDEYYYFVTDCLHSVQPGAWGAGYPEMYYFGKDHTYYWSEADGVKLTRKMATMGKWEIKNGELILNEMYELYLDSGEIVDNDFNEYPNNLEDKMLINYDTVLRKIDNTVTYKLEYVGISQYWLDQKEYDAEEKGVSIDDIIKDTPKDNVEYEYLIDGETWYSNVPADIEDCQWMNEIKTYIAQQADANL